MKPLSLQVLLFGMSLGAAFQQISAFTMTPVVGAYGRSDIRENKRVTHSISQLYNSNDPDSDRDTKEEEPFIVHVSFGDTDSTTTTNSTSRSRKGMEVSVYPGETILSALERNNLFADTVYPPYDCRRGNCLTCSARHDENSETNNLIPANDNGLAPYVAKTIANNGFVLTCSSTVSGPGVSLTIGANHQLWDFVYKGRLETEASVNTARAAMAKAIRRSAERNVQEWAEQTEKAYRNSSGE